ncbi:non-hem dioxygenase in morphine synthesis N-terminal [Phytophthora infestans]|uniref:Non-hem dioxygenase in morphine synthesis N-terminal n=1 Tax=Phytophthora infestans TaxID=4787 RepID=A0A833TER1_PHYIN|nr:non-hem dioxygenase in morphine synthesis N-terminal [Phytophthora infestans]
MPPANHNAAATSVNDLQVSSLHISLQVFQNPRSEIKLDVYRVPVVDISGLMAISKNTEVDAALQDPNHGELGKIIEEVRAAASEWGFFYVANHGLSEQEVGGFQTAMRAFFRLSKQIKRTIHRNTTNNRGYVEGELTKNKTDWKECFDFAGSGEDGPVTGKNDRLGEDRNQWLDETTLPGFRRKMRAYYDKMEHVACRLLKVFAVALGEEPAFFDQFFRSNIRRAR